MPQIFRPSSNTFIRAGFIGLIVGFFLSWGMLYAVYRSPYMSDVNLPRTQTVPFSHQHHVAGLGIDCRYCHNSVEDASFAGMPSTHTCMSCHSQVWTDAPMLAPVRASLARQKPLEWNRVNQLPDFTFFNHSIHVQKGIGCSSCHGQIDQMPLTAKAHSFYMRWCLDCHEAPERQLRTRDQIFNLRWEPPKDQTENGRRLVQEYGIRSERLLQLRDCSMCHR